ncbi:hypothetical protein HK100_001600, partial [Physocladia obscura]
CSAHVIKQDGEFISNARVLDLEGIDKDTAIIIDTGAILLKKEDLNWLMCPLAVNATNIVMVTTTKKSADDTISVRTVHHKCQTNLRGLKWKELDTDGNVTVQMLDNGRHIINDFINLIYGNNGTDD